jgi:hypothetical protein
MWRILAQSVAGTSHSARGAPCQDAHATEVVISAAEPALVVAVADGAGSARFAEVGAAEACRVLIAEARAELSGGTGVEHLSRDKLVRWLLTARSEIKRLADERGVRPRELACTAILAVIGARGASFAQVGDGAIVVPDEKGYGVVFWPAPAEYANVTDFLTDDGIEDRIVAECLPSRIDELAVFSDGLQRLALDYSSRRGHSGFFGPLFATIRDHPEPEQLVESLRGFLDSPQVNARTDDDKTLILATRLSPCLSTQH